MAPVRQDIVEQFDDPREWAITPDALVVNGPYKMTSYHSKNQIVNIGTTNESRYNNPEYDALIQAAAQELDLTKKLEILRQAEDMVIADLPIIPVYSYANVVAVQDHIDNFIMDTSGLIKFEYMTLK